MKKLLLCILFGLCFVLMILISGFYFVEGVYFFREKAYYADRNNYITEEAAVELIDYSPEYHRIVLRLVNIDPSYQSNVFVIKENNATEAIQNGVLDKVKAGDTITITSAPHYFGNGYRMPITGISIGEIEILNVEIGYQNLMNAYQTYIALYLRKVVLFTAVILLAVYLIGKLKRAGFF